MAAELCALVSSVVLARLVAPAEFGRTAVAVFLGMLAAAVAQQGVASFLVAHGRRRGITFAPRRYGVTGRGRGRHGAHGGVRRDPGAGDLRGAGSRTSWRSSSPVWLFAALTAVPVAELQRRLSFGRIGLVQASASVVGPAVAVVLARLRHRGRVDHHRGARRDGAPARRSRAQSVARPRPAWHPGRVAARSRATACPSSASSMLYAGVRNIDNLLLAAFMPALQVGLYMRAFVLGSRLPVEDQPDPDQHRLPGALARRRTASRCARMRARMIRVHATLLFPLLFGLIAVAPEFVPWMFGERWAGAASLTQILAVGGMIAAVGSGTSALLMATGHARALFVYNLVAFVAYTIAVLAADSVRHDGRVRRGRGRRASSPSSPCSADRGTRGRASRPRDRSRRRDPRRGGVASHCSSSRWPGFGCAWTQDSRSSSPWRCPACVGLAVYVAILRTFFPAIWADVRMVNTMLAMRMPLRSWVRRVAPSMHRRRAHRRSANEATADDAVADEQAGAGRPRSEAATRAPRRPPSEEEPSDYTRVNAVGR